MIRLLLRAIPAVGLAVLLTSGGLSAVAASAPGEGHDSMPGMEMPADDMPAHDMPAEQGEHVEAVTRPRGAVLGTFAGVNAAVLIGAAVLRRHPKDEPRPRRPARANASTLT